jgi:hypothetical protein
VDEQNKGACYIILIFNAVRNKPRHTLRATSGIFRVTTMRNFSFPGMDAMPREISVLLNFALEGNLDKSAQWILCREMLTGCSIWWERNDVAFCAVRSETSCLPLPQITQAMSFARVIPVCVISESECENFFEIEISLQLTKGTFRFRASCMGFYLCILAQFCGLIALDQHIYIDNIVCMFCKSETSDCI